MNGRDLALAHWNYVRGLLVMHRVDDKTLEMVEFHYINAFEHGYKHGLNQEKMIESAMKRLMRK
jgi:hypothetical protein